MAKTAKKPGKIETSRDVLPRYLAGAAWTPQHLRRIGGGSGKGGGKAKRKVHVLKNDSGLKFTNKGEVIR